MGSYTVTLTDKFGRVKLDVVQDSSAANAATAAVAETANAGYTAGTVIDQAEVLEVSGGVQAPTQLPVIPASGPLDG